VIVPYDFTPSVENDYNTMNTIIQMNKKKSEIFTSILADLDEADNGILRESLLTFFAMIIKSS